VYKAKIRSPGVRPATITENLRLSRKRSVKQSFGVALISICRESVEQDIVIRNSGSQRRGPVGKKVESISGLDTRWRPVILKCGEATSRPMRLSMGPRTKVKATSCGHSD